MKDVNVLCSCHRQLVSQQYLNIASRKIIKNANRCGTTSLKRHRAVCAYQVCFLLLFVNSVISIEQQGSTQNRKCSNRAHNY